MQITVNGESITFQPSGSIKALLQQLGAKEEHTAILLNGEIVTSKQWETTLLKTNDTLEMLVFVGGG